MNVGDQLTIIRTSSDQYHVSLINSRPTPENRSLRPNTGWINRGDIQVVVDAVSRELPVVRRLVRLRDLSIGFSVGVAGTAAIALAALLF